MVDTKTISEEVTEKATPQESLAHTAGNGMPSLGDVIRHEWKAISTNPAILLVLAGGIFLYGLLYNYMYAPNLVRKAPVAVVDLSHSALSREYVRWLDAAPQTSVRARTPNILEAREWMKKGEVTGILYIPSDFETRVARGETSVFTLYAATDAFLNFKGLQEAASRVMLAVMMPTDLPELYFCRHRGCWPSHHPPPSTYQGRPFTTIPKDMVPT